MKLLITGATGKVGSNLIRRLSLSPRPDLIIRALCHNRALPAAPGLEVVKGTISDRDTVERAMDGVSHVVHLATCKEIPELVMDVTVKGLFWLTEAFRASPTAKQFILIGGDASVGHFFYDHGAPVTETTPHRAYPGCYALSKVLEETLLQQTHIQYGLNVSCLRAPWIMEKDDFRYSLSFGDDVFGGPDWKTLVPPEIAERCRKEGTIPLLLDAHGRPLKRNFVHVDDLVDAILAPLFVYCAFQDATTVRRASRSSNPVSLSGLSPERPLFPSPCSDRLAPAAAQLRQRLLQPALAEARRRWRLLQPGFSVARSGRRTVVQPRIHR